MTNLGGGLSGGRYIVPIRVPCLRSVVNAPTDRQLSGELRRNEE